VEEYKMTYIWRLLSLIVLCPIGVFLIVESFTPPSMTARFWGVICIAVMLLIWVYCFTKKVQLSDDELIVSTLFGKKSVRINGYTKFKHHSIKINISREFSGGGAILQAIAETGSDATTTHINVDVSDGKSTIKLNSNISGIVMLKDELIRLEYEQVLPVLRSRYKQFESLAFGVVHIKQGSLIVGKKSILINKLADICFDNGKMVIKEKNSRKVFSKIDTKRIVNMHSLIAIISENISKM
jgi:hypothetical protein